MKFAALNTSIVVLAQAHNATILHPTFLVSQGIVPNDWQLAEQPICTPAISVVKYSNGIIFTAELNKLMVRDDAPKDSTPIPDLTRKYVEILPHVHYTALGINFSGYIECEDPEGWTLKRFLKQGPGNDDKLKPKGVGLKLVYPVENGVLNLNCDMGTVQKSGSTAELPCLLITGNYHIAVSDGDSLNETRQAIHSFSKRVAHFHQITDSIFGLEPCSP